MTFNDDAFEAVVVGAGPAGSYTALNLAKLGIKVKVFEEHHTVGLPSHCAGHIGIKNLRNLGFYPLPAGIVENTFCKANFYSPFGTKFSIKLSCPVTASVNRSKFDQYIAKLAEAAGVRYSLNSRVQSLILNDGLVRGVQVLCNNTKQNVPCRVVVDAEGVSSRLVRQAGLTPFKPEGLVYAVESETENVQNIEPNAVEVYFGKSYAPGFYGWLIPRQDGTAKVGLATCWGNPKQYLERLIKRHPVASKQFAKAKITQTNYHAITLGGLIPKNYTNGFLTVGDCASQVKPTTGGGVIFGLTCAKIAAQTTATDLKHGDVSAKCLSDYQKRCSEALNFDVKMMQRLRRYFNSLSDEKIDEMLRVCSRLGLDRALFNVEEIDFQGQLILKVLGKPAMISALAYFALLYLSAKP
jgi:digeranylgeranylglycerophospholipid reductase